MTTAPSPGRFVGRLDELARLRALLASGEKLVTVTGFAGAGKTTLALEALARDASDVVRVFLSDVETESGIVDRVAAGLGIDAGERTVAEAARLVGRRLAERPRLVFLDNAEQLTAVLGQLLARWLRDAPRTRFLVTSRERLDLSVEVVFELQPFTTPTASSLAELQASDAGTLFLETARRQGGVLSDAEAPAIAALLASLDGLPLAIELAARRLDVLSPAALLERLGHVGDAPRDAAHPSLSAAISRTWALLDAWEQEAVGQLAVFRGGFDLEGAAAVLALRDEGAPADAADVVAQLRRRGLVLRRGERFELYLVLRTFAERSTPPRSVHEARDRHARHFAGERHRLPRPMTPAAIARLTADEHNLTEAARRAFDAGLVEGAVSCVLALETLDSVRGGGLDLDALIDRALATTTHAADRCELLLGRARRTSTRSEDARVDARAALALARTIGDEALLALALIVSAILEAGFGELRDAEQLAAELEARESNDGWPAAVARFNLGVAHMNRGNDADGVELCERALSWARSAGNARMEGAVLLYLGKVAARRGEIETARGFASTASERLALVGDESHAGMSRSDLVLYDLDLGAPRDELRARLAELVRSPVPAVAPMAHGALGIVLLHDGRFDDAARAFAEALEEPLPVYLRWNRCLWHAARAGALALADRPAEARAALTLPVEPRGGAFVAETTTLYTAHVELAEQLGALAAGRPLASVRARVDDLVESSARSTAPPVRWARATLDFLARRVRRALADIAAERDLTLVSADGRFVAAPHRPPIDLANRRVPMRLLAVLATSWSPDGAEEITRERLLAAGWPEDRMLATTANNRLDVALSTLRKLGLDDRLVRGTDGWWLDPEKVAVVDWRPDPDD